MKTLKKLIIGLFLSISTSISFCQSTLNFKTTDSVVIIKKNTIVFKVNLQIIKSDTLNAYNLYGFYTLISPLPYFNLTDSTCCTSCRLGCYFQDSLGNLLRTKNNFDDRHDLLDKKRMKIKKVTRAYIIKHHMEKEELYPYYIFTNVLKMKKEDTLVKKDIYIFLKNIKLSPGTYYLSFGFAKFSDYYKEIAIQEMKSKDLDFYKNNQMENQYDKCIKSNKLKIIVK